MTENNKAFYEMSLSAMIYHGGLVILPLVPSLMSEDINDIRGQAHTIRPGTVGRVTTQCSVSSSHSPANQRTIAYPRAILLV